MHSTVTPLNRTALVTLEESIVQGVHDRKVIVQTSQGVLGADLAASCLVQPDMGDTVLISLSANRCYVLAVLEHHAEITRLKANGPLIVQAEGAIQLRSDQAIHLNAATQIHQTAPGIVVHSQQECHVNQSLTLHNTQLDLHGKFIKAQAEQYDGIFQRCHLKAKQIMRWVETVEVANIGSLFQNIRSTLSSRAKHTQITAREDVRVDAKRIHMG